MPGKRASKVVGGLSGWWEWQMCEQGAGKMEVNYTFLLCKRGRK